MAVKSVCKDCYYLERNICFQFGLGDIRERKIISCVEFKESIDATGNVEE